MPRAKQSPTRANQKWEERLVGQSLVRWACRKYKKLRRHWKRGWAWLIRLLDRQPTLLALWARHRSQVFTMGAV